jgi:hypothetical protein
VETVTQPALRDLAGSVLTSFPTLAAIGPVEPLPAVADLAAEVAGRKAAVGW